MTTINNEHTQISLDKLSKSKCNPRKKFNENSIKELAQSIKTDGLLHNLVVKPKGGKKKGLYEIISGERRFRALTFLAENGDIENDYLVPVDIRHGINKEQAQRIATVENLQREDMHPMDEAIAIASLLRTGQTIEDISVKTGFSIPLIKQRVRLTELCPQAQDALRENLITLSCAKALTLGSIAQQEKLIKDGVEHYSSERIKYLFTDEKIAISKAIFPLEEYTGTITSDLFANEDESYFDDREQFFDLQQKAIEKLKIKKESEGYSPVEIMKDRYVSFYGFQKAEDGGKGGCAIHYHPCGDIIIYDGVVIRKETTEGETRKKKATYSKPVCEYFAMHKSIAVQSALLKNPRVAKEIAVVQLLMAGTWQSKLNVPFHKCLTYFEDGSRLPSTLEDINIAITSAVKNLGMKNHNDSPCRNLNGQNQLVSDIYISVKALDDNEIDQAHLLLTTLCFGQSDIELDTEEDSLFNLVATDLKIDMSEHWIPDNDFLSRRNSQQLQDIILETETSKLFGSMSGYKKKEIVTILTKHFAKLASQDITDEKDIKAKNWLPEALLFPAIDPDDNQEEEGDQTLVA